MAFKVVNIRCGICTLFTLIHNVMLFRMHLTYMQYQKALGVPHAVALRALNSLLCSLRNSLRHCSEMLSHSPLSQEGTLAR